MGASTNANPISGGSNAAHTGPVNDLSGMVKKKKKPADESVAGAPSTEKRKAETGEQDAGSKKAKAAE